MSKTPKEYLADLIDGTIRGRSEEEISLALKNALTPKTQKFFNLSTLNSEYEGGVEDDSQVDVNPVDDAEED